MTVIIEIGIGIGVIFVIYLIQKGGKEEEQKEGGDVSNIVTLDPVSVKYPSQIDVIPLVPLSPPPITPVKPSNGEIRKIMEDIRTSGGVDPHYMTKIMSQVTLTGQDPKTLMSDPDDKLKSLAELIYYVRQGGRPTIIIFRLGHQSQAHLDIL
jgi:hypothetical protein